MKRPLLAAIVLTTATLSATGALADADSALRRAQLSAQLFAMGVKAGDPVLILTAAEIRKSAGLDVAAGAALSWQTMLEAAAPLIADDPALRGLALDLAAETAKGVAVGPIYRISELAPGETTLPAMEFAGGVLAEIYVETDPGSDLNLIVRDAEGNLVCADTDPSFVAYCGWTPATDGAFIVTVENRGNTPIDYALMTN